MKKNFLLNFLGGISVLFSASTLVYADPLTDTISVEIDSFNTYDSFEATDSEFELNKQKNKAMLDSSVDVKDLKNIEKFGFIDLSDKEINDEINKISEEIHYINRIADADKEKNITNNNVIVRSRNANVVRKNHNAYENYKAKMSNLQNSTANANLNANVNSNSYLALLSKYRDLTQEVILQGLKFIGVKYRFGGTSEKYGLDCSGYVQLVFKNSIGLLLPRTAAEMSNVGEKIHKNELKPGDLVFFNTMKRDFSHVGIYLGDNYFMHAPSTGAEVRLENMASDYWFRRFNGARRVLGNQNENLTSPRLTQIN